MKLNLLATTAVAALLASGGIYAQAQGPEHKQDQKAQMHEQKGPAAKQQPLAGKEDRGDQNQRTKNTAAEHGAPAGQHAEDAQQKGNAGRDQMKAKKDDASKAAEQSQQKKPDTAAAENQDQKKDQTRAAQSHDGGKNASEKHGKNRPAKDTSQTDKMNQQSAKDTGLNDKKGKDQAAKDNMDKTQTNATDQAKDRGQNVQSKQSADKSKPAGKPSTNAAADSKAGNANANSQPNGTANQNAQNGRNSSSQPANQQTGVNDKASTKVSDQDRSKIFSSLKSEKRMSSQQVNVDISVGQRLPARVHPRPLPRTVVQIAPEYRGYDYVMVRDEIAIVRPGTREVVDVIREPSSSSSFASSTTTTHQGGSTIQLTNQQRTRLRDEAKRFTTSQVSSSGSQCLSLQPVPSFLANENPDMRKYQMLAIGDDIILVDPKDKKVVDVIH